MVNRNFPVGAEIDKGRTDPGTAARERIGKMESRDASIIRLYHWQLRALQPSEPHPYVLQWFTVSRVQDLDRENVSRLTKACRRSGGDEQADHATDLQDSRCNGISFLRDTTRRTNRVEVNSSLPRFWYDSCAFHQPLSCHPTNRAHHNTCQHIGDVVVPPIHSRHAHTQKKWQADPK